MWSLENHCRERGRPYENEPSVLRDYSSSPPRTPKAPTHTLHGFIVHGTPGAREDDSYFSLPISLPADGSASRSPNTADAGRSTDTDSELTASNSTAEVTSNCSTIELDMLRLWTAFEAKIQNGDESAHSNASTPTSPLDVAKQSAGENFLDTISQRAVPEVPYHSFDEPFVFDTSAVPAHSPKPTSSRSATSPATNASSLRTTNNKRIKLSIDPADPTKSMYHNARATGVQFLSKLLDSPKVDIVNEATGEVYVRGVSLYMLGWFCSIEHITSLLFASHRSHQISVPPSHASKDGIIRVIRYMRRWCVHSRVHPTGELHAPPSIKEGIATSLACRFFGLDADAERIDNLVIADYMGSPRFFITDEDVELICCHYGGHLRDTPFGDAVVWFILEEVASGKHALADEVKWMLEQEEYKDLKARVREEMKKKEWRSLGRKGFLRGCQRERESRVASGDGETESAARGSSTSPRARGT